MKKFQKFFTAFFVVATSTIFIPTVYAGGDFSDSNAANAGNISIQVPVNSGNTSDSSKNSDKTKNKKIKGDNKPNSPKDDNNESEEDFDSPNENFNPPEEIPNLPNKNLNPPKDETKESDEDLNNADEDDEDFTENENISLDTGVTGDINGDSELNAVDLVVLQKYLQGKVFEINENEADIDGDGNISKFDVYALLNLIKAENKGTGDVNNDGKVDIYDVQTLTAYLANSSNNINSKNADLNGDGRISKDDLKILKKVISALQQ